MLHKAWNSKGEMPYCFLRSSIKFQGHTVKNITDFDPNWAFPDYRPVAAFKSPRFALLFKNINLDICLQIGDHFVSNSLYEHIEAWANMFTYGRWQCRAHSRLAPSQWETSLQMNEDVRIWIEISLKFVPKGPINNIPALVQIMACPRPGAKPLYEPVMVRLPTHVCVTWPK